MLAAVIPLGNEMCFVKGSGPEKTVAAHAEQIRSFIMSLQSKQGSESKPAARREAGRCSEAGCRSEAGGRNEAGYRNEAGRRGKTVRRHAVVSSCRCASRFVVSRAGREPASCLVLAPSPVLRYGRTAPRRLARLRTR